MKKQIFAAAAMITAMGLSACQAQNETGSVAQTQNEVQTGTDAGHGIFDIPVELEYARKFTITKDSDGCSLLTIDQGDPVVVIPEGNSVPETLPDHATEIGRASCRERV